MISIPSWLLYTAEQLLFILLIFSIFFFIRARKYKKQYLASNTRLQELSATLTKVELEAAENAKAEAEPEQLIDLADPEDQPEAAADPDELTRLQDKLALQSQRVNSLERFRSMYFDLKKKVEELMKLQQSLNAYIEKIELEDGISDDLKEDFEKLRKEKENLELQLQQVSEQIDVLIDGSTHTQTTNKEDADAANIIQNQQNEILNLVQAIADLEIESASSQRIMATVDQLNQQSKELNLAIEILQDENQFLLDQVETLVRQPSTEESQISEKMDLISSQLDDKQREFDQLYEKYAELESEYLKILDEQQAQQ